MNSTTPQDLLDLKSRIDLWRSTRRFIRQPIPDDIRLAIVQAASRHSPRLVKKVLKLDPYPYVSLICHSETVLSGFLIFEK